MVAIFVALMFIGLVLADSVVQRLEARRGRMASRRLARARWGFPEGVPISAGFPWGLPQGVCLSQNHTWFRPASSGETRVGADALLAHALGTLDKVVLPRVGDPVKKGEPLFYLVSEGRVMTIPSTVNGKVVAVNDQLRERPELVVGEPYSAGWVCGVVPVVLDDGSGRMRFGAKAASWLEREFERFNEFIFARVAPDLALGETSLDGGLPAPGYLAELGDEGWSAFEAEFLRWR